MSSRHAEACFCIRSAQGNIRNAIEPGSIARPLHDLTPKLCLSGSSAAVAPLFTPRNILMANFPCSDYMKWDKGGVRPARNSAITYNNQLYLFPSSSSLSTRSSALSHFSASCTIRSYQAIPTSGQIPRIPRFNSTPIVPRISRPNSTRQRPLQLRPDRNSTSQAMGPRSSPPHDGT